MTNKSITIGWLYPDLMSTYGDRGNILVLTKMCEWNGIQPHVMAIDHSTTLDELKKVDFIFGGGSQDIQQDIVMKDLFGKKGEVIKSLIEKNTPALFVCGSPQLMGKYYEPAVGKRIEGLGIFDMISINPGPNVPRCIGNIIGEVHWQNYDGNLSGTSKIVGFENHGGRTFLGKNVKPFAQVLHGYGNNGKDKTEGVIYKNAIGCYFHGPLLPKNQEIAKILIQKILFTKYSELINLNSENDKIAEKARQVIYSRYIK